MTTIEALPDLALLNIFDRLPVSDLLSTGRVCKLFRKFRRISARTRHRLILMVSSKLLNQAAKIVFNTIGINIPRSEMIENDDGSKMFAHTPEQREFHSFQITSSLSMEFVKFITKLFPEIFELEVLIHLPKSIKIIEHLIEMLKRYASKITLLRMHIGYDEQFDKLLVKNIGPHVRLLSTINHSMPALRRLELHFDVSLIKSRYARINLPVLAQLEQIVFSSSDLFNKLLDSIKRYAVPSANLTNIQICSFMRDPAVLLQFEPQFCARFADLNLPVYPDYFDQLTELFERYRNLTCLSLFFHSQSINRDELYRSLRPLTKLVYIEFDVIGHEMMDFAFDPTEGDIGNDAQQNDALPSIKVITYIINGEIESHGMFAFFRMGHIFPNVQVVELRFEVTVVLCRECQRNNVDPSKLGTVCFKPMLHTFELALPKLKRILTEDTEYKMNV